MQHAAQGPQRRAQVVRPALPHLGGVEGGAAGAPRTVARAEADVGDGEAGVERPEVMQLRSRALAPEVALTGGEKRGGGEGSVAGEKQRPRRQVDETHARALQRQERAAEGGGEQAHMPLGVERAAGAQQQRPPFETLRRHTDAHAARCAARRLQRQPPFIPAEDTHHIGCLEADEPRELLPRYLPFAIALAAANPAAVVDPQHVQRVHLARGGVPRAVHNAAAPHAQLCAHRVVSRRAAQLREQPRGAPAIGGGGGGGGGGD